MAVSLTMEQVLALAPDAGSASAGKGLANTRKWTGLGSNESAIWGLCQGSGKDPYQTRVDLAEPAFKCSCPSRKFPCKHSLGLMLVHAQSPAAFPQGEAPGWVSEWLDGRKARAEKAVERAETKAQKEADPVAQAKRVERRESRVSAGVDELSLWMRDLARRGIGAARADSFERWDSVARRMVDAQAPGLARAVREMAGMAAAGQPAQARLLRRLGRTYLLARAWNTIDTLPAPLREDVRTQIGFTQTKDEVLAAGETVAGSWFVWGQYAEELDDGLRAQRTWLWEISSGRRALLLSFAPRNGIFETNHVPGTALRGELVFHPSAFPMRAMMKGAAELTPGPPVPPRADSIDQVFHEYATAIAANPWLDRWPCAIGGATIVGDGALSRIVDREGMCVPLRMADDVLWRTLAITAGRPAVVFGEWDEDAFELISFWHAGLFVPARST